MGKKPSAEIVRAPAAGEVTPALNAAQRRLLAEALRLGEETRDEIESSLVRFGRWALVNVFDNDASEALDNARGNPVWESMIARAGGPTLRLSTRMLSVALHVAAWDKRINDEAWRGLDLGRKELLLPLGDDARLREAAQHVSTLKLTQRATRDFVGTLLAQTGGRAVRLTAPRLSARVRRFRAGIEGRGFLKRVQTLARSLDEGERSTVTAEVEALRDAAEAILAQLKNR